MIKEKLMRVCPACEGSLCAICRGCTLCGECSCLYGDEAVESGTHPDFASMVNSLANILIDAAGKGYVSSNDLDFANNCLDKVIPHLKPSGGIRHHAS